MLRIFYWLITLMKNACFLFQGSVRFRVAVPKMQDKPEFNLNGQMLNFSLPLTDAVSLLTNISSRGLT